MALVADATVAQAHAQREAVERNLTLVYSRALKKLGKWIIAHYGLPESITAADAPLTPDGLLEMLGQWDEIVGKELRPQMMKAFEKHWGWVTDNLAAGPLDRVQTDVILGPNVRDVRAAAAFDSAAPRIRDIGKTMHSELSTLLRTKYEEGSTPDDTAAAIREMVGNRMLGKRGVTSARAQMIARTETAALVSGADQAAAEELESAGIKAQKEWLATNDGRTRHEHDELDGKRVGVKESFSVNGTSLRYPGDPMGRADLVINCRCTTLLRVDEEPDTEIPTLEEEKAPTPPPATVTEVGSPAHQNAMWAAERERKAMETGIFKKGKFNAERGWTSDTRQAWTQYVEGGNTQMNSRLRSPEAFLEKEGKDWTDLIDDYNGKIQGLFAKNKLDQDIIVARGIKADINPKVGDVLSDKGFMSTTTDFAEAQKFAAGQGGMASQAATGEGWVFSITARKGTPALPGADYQKEIFFPPGTKHRVIKIDNDKKIIYTEIGEEASETAAVKAIPDPNPAVVDKVFKMLEDGTNSVKDFQTALAVAKPQAQANIQAGLKRWEEHLARMSPAPVRKFKTADEARSWAYSNWGGPERFAPDELAVVRGYTGARYGPINSSLRSGRVTKEVKTMDAAMERAARVPEDIVVARTTNLRQFGFTATKGFKPETIIGQTFADKGFLSTGVAGRVTTLDRSNNVRLSIKVPKGSRGIYVSGGGKGSSNSTVISESGRGESELILDRGSKLKVVSVKKRGDSWDVVAELVGQGDSTFAEKASTVVSMTRTPALSKPPEFPAMKVEPRNDYRDLMKERPGGVYGYQTPASLEWYKGYGYAPVNSYLRGERTGLTGPDGKTVPAAKIQSNIKSLDTAFQRSSVTLSQDMTVQRGVRSFDLDVLKEGETLVESGYSSTTLDSKVAEKFARGSLMGSGAGDGWVFDILVPKGSKVVVPGNQKGEEHEVILPRNTKYRVHHVDRARKKAWLEVVK